MSWYITALASAFFVGMYEIVEKKALLREHSLAFLFSSSILMLVLSVPFLFLGDLAYLDLKMTLYVFTKCIFAVGLFVLCGRAMKHLEISEFAPLMNLSPLVLFIPSIFFLQEKFTLIHFSGVLMIILGAYTVELKDGWRTPIKRLFKNKYIHLLFLAFIFNALSATMDKFILVKDINIDTFFVYNRIFIALLLLFVYLIFKKKSDNLRVTFKRSFWWVLFAAIFFMGADYFYFSAVAVPAALIALVIPLKRTGTLLATVLGGEMMKEKNLLRKAVACLIMIAGVTLIVI